MSDSTLSVSSAPLVRRPLACVILAAGEGTRLKSDIPKVLHRVAGEPMIAHVIRACEALAPARIVVVVSPANDDLIRAAVAPYLCAVQPAQRGTADALRAAEEALQGHEGDVMVLFGDTPLVTPATLQALQDARNKTDAAVAVAGFRPASPGAYGRLVVDSSGGLEAIVEAADATPAEQALTLCNGGVMAFDAARLGPLLAAVTDTNAKHEFYLTDTVRLARKRGWACAVATLEADDVLGVNTRTELALVNTLFQNRLRQAAMAQGVTLEDPATTILSADTVFGRDVVIGSHVVIDPGVVIEDRAVISPFCHLTHAHLGPGATVGPFARLRPGTEVGEDAHVGNFVELKKTRLGRGAKAGHLTYLGDSEVGDGANIGAGTITCNYDGFAKATTRIGAGAFIGSNTALVAPVAVGKGAYVGAGSVITKDVPDDALALARSPQDIRFGWAKKFRALMRRDKKG